MWIEYNGEKRRYAVPPHYSAALIAREAYIAFTGIQGKVGDFPKNTSFVLQEAMLVEHGRPVKRKVGMNVPAKELHEDWTYALELVTDE